MIFSNGENIYTNETIVYDLLDNKNLNENCDICIYLLASELTNIKKECSKCTFLNENSDDICEMCFSKLSINEIPLKDKFECAICLEKSLPIENEFILRDCNHIFCK